MARTGYTLPVFAVASAKAALLLLVDTIKALPSPRAIKALPSPRAIDLQTVELDLLPGVVEIPIAQAAMLEAESALAITISDPGDNLDLTRHTPIWAWVRLGDRAGEQYRQAEALVLAAGEGLGKTTGGDPAIYSYARRLFDANLLPLIPIDRTATVTIILPEGRQLAKRTSNEAFGVLEGLSLLGTSGISQPLSAADHLESFRRSLQEKAQTSRNLVFCIGSNGQQVGQRLGLPEASIVSTGNWIGALLVEAGLYQIESVLLLGYHGKLIKLAGGIFNTSSHLADAKLEILAAAAVEVGGLTAVRSILAAQTADAAHKTLVELGIAESIFNALANTISQKSQAYVQKYANASIRVGTVLFDRRGKIIAQDPQATRLITDYQSADH